MSLPGDCLWHQVRIGKALCLLHQKKFDKVDIEISEARLSLMAPIAAASMESYRRVYPMLLSLHLLYEIEQATTQVQPATDLRVTVLRLAGS